MIGHADDIGDRVIVVQGGTHFVLAEAEYLLHERRAGRFNSIGLAQPERLLLARDPRHGAAGPPRKWVGFDDLYRWIIGKEFAQRDVRFGDQGIG